MAVDIQESSSDRVATANTDLCGLATLVRSSALVALENIALWHERDISHSSVERIILPSVTTALETMITSVTDVVEQVSLKTSQ
jgi:adenylosuccinate lyase